LPLPDASACPVVVAASVHTAGSAEVVGSASASSGANDTSDNWNQNELVLGEPSWSPWAQSIGLISCELIKFCSGAGWILFRGRLAHMNETRSLYGKTQLHRASRAWRGNRPNSPVD
jgi:hypothetical protein